MALAFFRIFAGLPFTGRVTGGMIRLPMAGLWMVSSFWLYQFALVCAAGAGLGLYLSAVSSKRPGRTIDFGIAFLLGALIGGRFVFVLIARDAFRAQWTDAFLLWNGGFDFAGAAAGGLLGLWVYARVRKTSFRDAASEITPLAGALAVSVWLGCWLSGIAYGPVSSAAGGLPAADAFGAIAWRFPLQAIGAAGGSVFLWLGRFLRKKYAHCFAPGMDLGLVLAGNAALAFGLFFLRADFSPMWHNIRVEMWEAGAVFLMAVFLFVLAGVYGRSSSSGDTRD